MRLLFVLLVVIAIAPARAGEPTAMEARLVAVLTDPGLFDLQAEDFETRYGFRGPVTTADKTADSWSFDVGTPDGFAGGKAFFRRRAGAAGYGLLEIQLLFSLDDGISATRLQKALEARYGPAFVSAPPGSNATLIWRWSSLRLIKVTTDVAGAVDPLVFGVEIARTD